MRTFISIDIPEEVKEEIKKIQEKLPEFKGKKTEFENLHLTLKFLGELNEEEVEDVKNKLREVRFFEIDIGIDSIGVFSERFVRIVWLYVKGTEELQRNVDEKLSELGFEKEKRFMSHLTIARVKEVNDKKEFLNKLKKLNVPRVKFLIKDFRFKKSILKPEGPIYETIGKYSLKS